MASGRSEWAYSEEMVSTSMTLIGALYFNYKSRDLQILSAAACWFSFDNRQASMGVVADLLPFLKTCNGFAKQPDSTSC